MVQEGQIPRWCVQTNKGDSYTIMNCLFLFLWLQPQITGSKKLRLPPISDGKLTTWISSQHYKRPRVRGHFTARALPSCPLACVKCARTSTPPSLLLWTAKPGGGSDRMWHMCMILGRPSQAAGLLVIVDLQLAHSLCRPASSPLRLIFRTSLRPVSLPHSQVGMHSNRAITRDPVVMSICVFFPADRGSHSVCPSRVTAEMRRVPTHTRPTSKPASPTDANQCERVQAIASM